MRNLAWLQHNLCMVRLLTFTCYGCHLPGDIRGSFDHARNGERRFLPPNPSLERYCREQMRQAAFFLSTAESRTLVRDAIIDVCRFRSWSLYAVHVRTSHVHGVVGSETQPDRVLHDWKSYAMRALRSAGLVLPGRTVWTRGGNAHNLVSGAAVNDAIRYVIERQGEPMEIYVCEPERLPPPWLAGL